MESKLNILSKLYETVTGVLVPPSWDQPENTDLLGSLFFFGLFVEPFESEAAWFA